MPWYALVTPNVPKLMPNGTNIHTSKRKSCLIELLSTPYIMTLKNTVLLHAILSIYKMKPWATSNSASLLHPTGEGRRPSTTNGGMEPNLLPDIKCRSCQITSLQYQRTVHLAVHPSNLYVE